MLYPMLLLLLSCTPEPTPGPDSDSARSESPSPDDSAGETGETGEEATATCPEGMSGITDDDGVLRYCIDTYEVLLSDDVALSLEGVVPTINVTFDEAVVICANTPVEVDAVDSGSKWLATSAEWEDAADGTFGEGGLNYPFGDEFDESVCSTVTATGEAVYEALSPTGSFPDCVSPAGAFDMAGNAWEWADPGRVVDNAAFLALQPDLSTSDEDELISLSGEVGGLLLDVPGLAHGSPLRIDTDGRFVVETREGEWNWSGDNPRGYVVEYDAELEERLMVEVVPIAEIGGDASLVVRWDEDGQAMTDKRGGAFYVGSTEAYLIHNPYLGHPHDFEGTIGFRCACEPVSAE